MLVTSISLYSQSTDWWECMYCKRWTQDSRMAPGAWLQFSVSRQHFCTQLLYNDGLRGKTLFWPQGDLFVAIKWVVTRTHWQLGWVAALRPTLLIQPWYLVEHQSIGPIKSLTCWWCRMKIVWRVTHPQIPQRAIQQCFRYFSLAQGGEPVGRYCVWRQPPWYNLLIYIFLILMFLLGASHLQ